MKKILVFLGLLVSTSAANAVCPTSLNGSFVANSKAYRFTNSDPKQLESVSFGTISIIATTTSYTRATGNVVGTFKTITTNFTSGDTVGITGSEQTFPFFYNVKTCTGFANVLGPGVASINKDNAGFSINIANSGAQISAILYQLKESDVTDNDTNKSAEFVALRP